MDPRTVNALWTLSATGGRDVFAIGSAGTVLRRGRRCSATELTCNDGTDDDCDDTYDCGDSDCSIAAACMGGGLCPPPVQGPTTITCASSIIGNTAASTRRNIDRYACAPLLEGGPELTYTFTATTTGPVTATLSNVTADLDVIVMRAAAGGGCEPLNPGCIASGDTSATFAAQSGQTYYVAVDGYNAAAGRFTLDLTCN